MKEKEEKEKEKERQRRLCACSKGELAQRYLPDVSAAAARRTVRSWVEKNAELKAALERTGYTSRTVLLTPAQIQLHYDYLGEP